ncbi:MAG: phospho-N-acetylmuramoyl-pentapeptide-transferase [Clostridia bacterium]|nr:phospho-N-acetylmuramoyl-pentapeptide-transferase [Clostridia bacterium]
MAGIILTGGGISLLICVILVPLLIPVLRRLKFGQEIREEGPAWHAKKSGTPTMGGIAIAVAVVVAMIATGILFRLDINSVICLSIGALLYGAVGYADDHIKVINKRNLGLTSAQKFIAQLIVSVAITVFSVYSGIIDTQIIIPFIKQPVDLGIFTVILVVFVQLAVVNSANLTDGLDGLATSVTLVVAAFLAICAVKLGNSVVAVFMSIVAAACLGFLFFNANPAKIFMGDTGSLFLGGCVALGAIMLKLPLILIVAAGVYLCETLSVILQVTSFKLTGKRIFKMSPIHHHFEMCGLNERQIVLLFSLVSAILCIISYYMFF